MKTTKLIKALRRMGVLTGGLMCVGCEHENGCSVHGCAVIREAADMIEELNNFIDSQCARLLEKLQKAEAAIPRWVSVEERPPERFVPVIVYRGNGKVEQGCRDMQDWWKIYGTRTKKVTHWMPLPEPPEKEDKLTADVTPVQHGRWEVVVGSDGKEHMVCTVCRKQQDLTGVFSYCPNCGAKMDEEDRNHDADE